MAVVAYVFVTLATLAACYVAKILVVDIAWADLRQSRDASTIRVMLLCIAIAAVVVAIPAALAGGLVANGLAGWAIVVSIGSIVLSGAGFVLLAGAFKP
jgi:hypothetical protein